MGQYKTHLWIFPHLYHRGQVFKHLQAQLGLGARLCFNSGFQGLSRVMRCQSGRPKTLRSVRFVRITTQTDSMLGGWMMSNFWLKSASHCRCQCSTKKVRFQAFTRLKYFWKKSLMFGFSTPKIWFCFLDLSADDSHACVSKLLHTCIGNLATIIIML